MISSIGIILTWFGFLNLILMCFSNKKNLNEAAKNFYHYLHKLDQSKCKKIAVVEIPDKGLGKTINDRLRRAIK